MAKKTIKETMTDAHRQLADAAAQNRQPDPHAPKLSVPPHMADRSMGGGYVSDNAPTVRAKNAQTDKNLNSVPTPRRR